MSNELGFRARRDDRPKWMYLALRTQVEESPGDFLRSQHVMSPINTNGRPVPLNDQ